MSRFKKISKELCISKSHLIYLFKEQTGCTPINYFIHLKIQKDCNLLDVTKLNVKEIAHVLGYNDPLYFGEISPIIIDSCGVGQYDASKGKILAANYFKASGIKAIENKDGDFVVRIEESSNNLAYPNILNCSSFNHLKICLSLRSSQSFVIRVLDGLVDGELLDEVEVLPSDQNEKDVIVRANLSGYKSVRDICLCFSGDGSIGTEIDWIEVC